jgi:pimeloyl-ACP methyl ester carboxylesterase
MIKWLLLALLATSAASAAQPWMTLPPTPTLPHADRAATAPVNGIQLWYAVFGTGHGSPILILHGGLANSDYWGDQVRVLSRTHQVIVIDSRGHGRSARNAVPLSYTLMATDAVALLDELNIQKVAVIGWSDGAITALDMAMHRPERVSRVFAFAANSDPSGVKDVHKSTVFDAFIARAGQEYARLNPTPDGYKAFDSAIETMWATQPHFTDAALRAITLPVWIVDADHDEAIKRTDTDKMAALIPDARELILPGVSHFAFLQDPAMFTYAVGSFLGDH